MASIDAFWDLAASEPASERPFRASLRRLRPAAVSTTDREAKRQRTLILVGIALLHVLMLLALRAAMQPSTFVRTHDAAPMQITFIRLPQAVAVPRPIATAPSVPHPRATEVPQRSAPRSDELQAVTIAPSTLTVPTVVEPPRATLYSADGALLVPAASISTPPRDLLAHRSVDFMLPGAARNNSPDFHVRDDSPQETVNSAGRRLSTLIGNSLKPRNDRNGVIPMVADRGLRTSGRDTDPCEDIVLTEVDPNASEKEVEQAVERDARHCVGH